MKYYYLYEIRNKVNGKIYVGVHSTDQLDDNYMGSGTVLRRAIAKYGKDQFEKTILKQFSSVEEMFKGEAEMVSAEFLKRDDVYNITEGGNGFCSESSHRANDLRKELIANDAEWLQSYSEKLSQSAKIPTEEHQQIVAATNRKNKSGAAHNPHLRAEMVRRSQTPEARARHRAAVKGQGKGEKNSQFGSMWITDGEQNKKISKDDSIPVGWRKGRKLK